MTLMAGRASGKPFISSKSSTDENADEHQVHWWVSSQQPRWLDLNPGWARAGAGIGSCITSRSIVMDNIRDLAYLQTLTPEDASEMARLTIRHSWIQQELIEKQKLEPDLIEPRTLTMHIRCFGEDRPATHNDAKDFYAIREYCHAG